MRFFEQQRQAKAQTLRLVLLFAAKAQTMRLVLLFAITLLMLVLALNAALAAGWWLVSWQTASYPA